MWIRPVVDEIVVFFERALASDHRNPALPGGGS